MKIIYTFFFCFHCTGSKVIETNLCLFIFAYEIIKELVFCGVHPFIWCIWFEQTANIQVDVGTITFVIAYGIGLCLWPPLVQK